MDPQLSLPAHKQRRGKRKAAFQNTFPFISPSFVCSCFFWKSVAEQLQTREEGRKCTKDSCLFFSKWDYKTFISRWANFISDGKWRQVAPDAPDTWRWLLQGDFCCQLKTQRRSTLDHRTWCREETFKKFSAAFNFSDKEGVTGTHLSHSAF